MNHAMVWMSRHNGHSWRQSFMMQQKRFSEKLNREGAHGSAMIPLSSSGNLLVLAIGHEMLNYRKRLNKQCGETRQLTTTTSSKKWLMEMKMATKKNLPSCQKIWQDFISVAKKKAKGNTVQDKKDWNEECANHFERPLSRPPPVATLIHGDLSKLLLEVCIDFRRPGKWEKP